VRTAGPRLLFWLLGANLVVLPVPLAAVVALRVYDTLLVRQTERQLIVQSVLVAEAFRSAWLAARGAPEAAPFRPPGREDDPFVPVEPVTDLTYGLLPPQPEVLPSCTPEPGPALDAARAIEPALRRAQVFNLSAARVLDTRGCVLATTRGEGGLSLSGMPEVQEALQGRYAAVARERVSDEPLPPISDVRSRGAIRLFTALPVFSDGEVVAVVRMSRTSLDALTSLWHSRRALLLSSAATVLAALVVSFGFAWLIARPLGAIARSADALARGGGGPLPGPSRLAPAEVESLRRSLETMTARLRARADDLAAFAADASHELKGPITAVRGAAELLREQGEGMDGAQRRRFLEHIEADVGRMERLVSRLLQLARIGRAPDGAERADVAPFFRWLTERHGEAVQVELRDPPATVPVSADHLRSAVENLVENAVRHRRAAPVSVVASGRDGRLVVVVRDDGPGLSEANRARVFQRFFTTRADEGGTGLGLAIVKAIADRHGGAVSFRTGADGTAFELVL
jgi:signal transduction histidine kinase